MWSLDKIWLRKDFMHRDWMVVAPHGCMFNDREVIKLGLTYLEAVQYVNTHHLQPLEHRMVTVS